MPVIMNLTDMNDSDAKRLVDFAAGLVFGLRGSIERVTSKVFLLSPAHVEVGDEDSERRSPARCSTRADRRAGRLGGPLPDRLAVHPGCWSVASSSTGSRTSLGTGGHTGSILVIAEGIYSITDPPLKALRKVIPPIPIGSIRIDRRFLLLFVIAFVLQSVLSRL